MDLGLRLQILLPVGWKAGHEFYPYQQYLAGVWRSHVVLERINLEVKEGVLFDGRRLRLRKIAFLRLLLGRSNRPGARLRSTVSRWLLSRIAVVAWCFNVIRSFRTSACWIT
jgi:hypothetical protein